MAKQPTVSDRLEYIEQINRLIAIEKELLLLAQRSHELELELKTLIPLKAVREKKSV